MKRWDGFKGVNRMIYVGVESDDISENIEGVSNLLVKFKVDIRKQGEQTRVVGSVVLTVNSEIQIYEESMIT